MPIRYRNRWAWTYDQRRVQPERCDQQLKTHSWYLFASSVKRQVGIKDYGTIFPGHGGILDRFDSVMFIAPFVSIAVRYFFYVL